MRFGFYEQALPDAVGRAARTLHQGGVVTMDAPEELGLVLIGDVLDLVRGKACVIDYGLSLEAVAKEGGAGYFSFARMEEMWAQVRPVKDVVTPVELLRYLTRRDYRLYVVLGLDDELRSTSVGPVAFTSQTAMMLRKAMMQRAGLLYWGQLEIKSWDPPTDPVELVYDPPLPEIERPGPRSRPSGLS